MFYIEKNDKPNFLERKFKIIKVLDNIIKLPIQENIELDEKQIEKLAAKTKKIIKKNSNSKKIVISRDVYEFTKYINYLNTYGFEIQNGRWLFEILLPEVVEYIFDKKGIEKENISILINDLTEVEIENIKILARKYKSINIVTNHVQKFKKIQKYLQENEGIIITITNNKKKSLMKSEIILNIDFPKELINKYNIPENAIIVNIIGKVKINKKRFNGLNINDYKIDFRDDEKQEQAINGKYYLKDLYESELYKKQPVKEIRKKTKIDKVIIKKLILNNGEL